MICYLKRRLSLFTFCHQREAGTPSHVMLTLYLFSAKRGRTMADRAKGRASSGYAESRQGWRPFQVLSTDLVVILSWGTLAKGCLPQWVENCQEPPLELRACRLSTGSASVSAWLVKDLNRVTTNLMTVLKKENKTVCWDKVYLQLLGFLVWGFPPPKEMLQAHGWFSTLQICLGDFPGGRRWLLLVLPQPESVQYLPKTLVE